MQSMCYRGNIWPHETHCHAQEGYNSPGHTPMTNHSSVGVNINTIAWKFHIAPRYVFGHGISQLDVSSRIFDVQVHQ